MLYNIFLDDKINDFMNNPYFVHIKSNNCDKQAFLESQIAFIKAVKYWSIILCHYMNSLDFLDDKLLILKNINDEYGNGIMEKCHTMTYYSYLVELGIKPIFNPYDKVFDKNNNVAFFINRIKIRKHDKVLLGSILCAIEYLYIYVSDLMCTVLGDKFNIIQEHYSLHSELDSIHAAELFKTIHDDNQDNIITGLQEGYDIFYNLYSSLFYTYFTTYDQHL